MWELGNWLTRKKKQNSTSSGNFGKALNCPRSNLGLMESCLSFHTPQANCCLQPPALILMSRERWRVINQQALHQHLLLAFAPSRTPPPAGTQSIVSCISLCSFLGSSECFIFIDSQLYRMPMQKSGPDRSRLWLLTNGYSNNSVMIWVSKRA